MHGVLTRKVQNNASAVIRAHLIGSNTCTAPEIGVTSVSDTPILDLCRLLVARGHDPSTPMEVWRGTMLALSVRTIGEAAQLEVATDPPGFKLRTRPRRAPYVQKNDRVGADGRGARNSRSTSPDHRSPQFAASE
jgi:hypothetical protein